MSEPQDVRNILTSSRLGKEVELSGGKGRWTDTL